MPSYDMTGIVKLVMDEQKFTSGFTKREFVVTTEGERFPQEIKFECVKEKVALLDGVKPGQRVAVTFDLRGNEYNGRYFVNLTAWRLGPAAGGDGVDAAPADEDKPPLESLTELQEPEDVMPF